MYKVRYAQLSPELKGSWDGAAWQQVDTLDIDCFRREGSGHKPKTSARLLYNDEGILGIFRVEDRYVRCVHTQYGEAVYKDSCVEIFFRPKANRGYFNFEFNCGGALLCSYITNPERTPDGFKEYVLIPKEEGRPVQISHSMPQVVNPEIAEPTTWTLEFFIPFSLIERYAGTLGSIQGQQWKANFYKCGDETSHPHWASWQPLPEKNFHLPEYFGDIIFSDPIR